jgi:molecular chaperone Hsp33
LHRLFHEEKVRLFDPEAIAFECQCSRQKISGTLLALGQHELESILQERDDIEVDCQFCGAQYVFDKVDIENLLANPLFETQISSPTRH